MADFLPLPDKEYQVIYADPPWEYRQHGTTAKSERPFWGMGAYTRANAEVCLLGVSPGFKARERIRSHRVHQVITAPFEGHSKKPDETRRRIVELLGDVPRLELFARDRAPGWDAWGNEVPPAE